MHDDTPTPDASDDTPRRDPTSAVQAAEFPADTGQHFAGRLLRSLLDPQSLRVMMGTGGGLLAVGLAIWLWWVGVFRDPLVAGIAMTGLLILADQQVGRFWEVLAPSMFPVVLGSLAVHAERLFPVSTTAFSRERFGLAFFRAGHVVMAVGLVVLLIGRLARWLDLSLLQPLPMVDPSWLVRPSVVEVEHQKMLAMLLVLGASYTYGFSQFVVGRHQAR